MTSEGCSCMELPEHPDPLRDPSKTPLITIKNIHSFKVSSCSSYAHRNRRSLLLWRYGSSCVILYFFPCPAVSSACVRAQRNAVYCGWMNVTISHSLHVLLLSRLVWQTSSQDSKALLWPCLAKYLVVLFGAKGQKREIKCTHLGQIKWF